MSKNVIFTYVKALFTNSARNYARGSLIIIVVRFAYEILGAFLGKTFQIIIR